jgi:hypothetical protein
LYKGGKASADGTWKALKIRVISGALELTLQEQRSLPGGESVEVGESEMRGLESNGSGGPILDLPLASCYSEAPFPCLSSGDSDTGFSVSLWGLKSISYATWYTAAIQQMVLTPHRCLLSVTGNSGIYGWSGEEGG